MGRFESVKQFAAACWALIHRLGRFADYDKRCSVFRVGPVGTLWVVDHRQHGFTQRLGVRQLWISGKRRKGADHKG